MLIEIAISATHGTSKDAPISVETTIPVGTIAKVRARMPTLAASTEIGFQLLHDASSFAPNPSNDLWIAHDQQAATTVEWEEEHPITGRAGALRIRAYNTHATIDYIIRLDIVLEPEFFPRKILAQLNALTIGLSDFLKLAAAPPPPVAEAKPKR